MKKIVGILLFVLAITMPEVLFAQCAMCKAVVESADKDLVEGVNNGILYMMGVPYLLMMVIGFAWYKRFANSQGEKKES